MSNDSDEFESGGGMPLHLLTYLINRLTARINQQWLDEIRPHGLTVPRWQVLAILSAFDGARIGQLAEMSGMEQPVVSRLVDQMQRDGLVERRKGEGRAVQVWSSEAGRALHQQLTPAAGEYLDTLVASLDERERATLMTLLGKVMAAADSDWGAPF